MPRQDAEELARRRMIALIRSAGTDIRRETIRRCGVTAEANIDYILSLQRDLAEDYSTWIIPFMNAGKVASKGWRRGDDISDIAFDAVNELVGSGIQPFICRSPEILAQHVKEINDFAIHVVNPLLEDLSKEGIYVPRLMPIAEKTALPLRILYAKEIANRCCGILQGLIDASSDKRKKSKKNISKE
jgi:hypothetical protein